MAILLTQLRVAMEGALAAGIHHTNGFVQQAEALLKLSKVREVLRADLNKRVVEVQHLDLTLVNLDALRAIKAQLSAVIHQAKNQGLTEDDVCRAETRRRRIHNAIEDRKGRLRVFCRVRPMHDSELLQGDSNALTIIDDMRIEAPCGTFSFDSVFSPGTQEEVFEDCRDLVKSAVDGHNVTIFAYGQTGAGKTHTMYGSLGDEGIAKRTIHALFDITRDLSQRYTISVTGSMVELYNNQFLDLLAQRSSAWTFPEKHKKLTVKQDQHGAAQIDNLSELALDDADEAHALLERGLSQRSVAANTLNVMSSRSHLIFTMKIACENRGTGEVTQGKILLCDLAGSERLKKSEVTLNRKKEAIEINKSLTALGDVVEAIVKCHKQVPYRNHKLTQLMQDSLGGDAKTLMFVNCSPSSSSAHETSMSLKFASKAKLKPDHFSSPRSF